MQISLRIGLLLGWTLLGGVGCMKSEEWPPGAFGEAGELLADADTYLLLMERYERAAPVAVPSALRWTLKSTIESHLGGEVSFGEVRQYSCSQYVALVGYQELSLYVVCTAAGGDPSVFRVYTLAVW